MPEMGLGFFQSLLAALQAAFLPGLGLMQPVVRLVSGVLIMLELVRMATGFACGVGRPWELVAWTMSLVVKTYVITEWAWLTTMLQGAFVQLGLVAGGSAITEAQFLDPGAYLQMGLQTAEVLYTGYMDRVAIADVFHAGALVDAVLYILAWLSMLLAYVYMAFQVFMIQMEMALAVVIGYPFLAFAHSRYTAWIARGAIAYPINQGVAFLTLAFLAAVLFRFLKTPLVTAPGIKGSVLMVLGAWCMALLFVKARKLASGIITGQPTLTAGSLIGGLVAGAAATVLGVGAAVGGARLALGGVSRLSAGMQRASAIYAAAEAHASGMPNPLLPSGQGFRSLVIAGGQSLGGALGRIAGPARAALAGTYHVGGQAGVGVSRPSVMGTVSGRGGRGYGGMGSTATRSMLSFIDDDAPRGLHY